MYEIRHYLKTDGQDVFFDWLKQVRDPIAKVQIIKRINRLELGNLGDHKFCRDGVWELRFMSVLAIASITHWPGCAWCYSVRWRQGLSGCRH